MNLLAKFANWCKKEEKKEQIPEFLFSPLQLQKQRPSQNMHSTKGNVYIWQNQPVILEKTFKNQTKQRASY